MKNNLIAHRGNNVYKAENRLEFIKKTLNEDYISGIEIDVRKTLDNKLVLSHNLLLRGKKIVNINKVKLKYLKNNNFYIFKEPFFIHTLDELLKIKTDKFILIEVKDNIPLDLLHKYIKGCKLNIYICSFNYNFIVSFKKKYPVYKCGLIVGYLMNIKKNYDIFDFLMFHHSSILKTDKPYFIWTVNNKDVYNKVKAFGYITDKARLLYKKNDSSYNG